MSERPKLNREMNSRIFQDYYYLHHLQRYLCVSGKSAKGHVVFSRYREKMTLSNL